MTRTEAVAIITASLPSLDEQQAAALAEIAQAMIKPTASLKLTPEERAGVERAREDFKHGRTHSSSEARAMTAAFLSRLRGGPSTL